ncbi:MAG: HU family DNA-binding protein [Candidatus Pelagibacter sp.]
MAIVKSKLIKKLSKNYPNFLKKDLEKFSDIILDEIKQTLKRGERVELRGFGIFSTNIQKARISRNPKTGEKVNTPEKKTIHFKMAKDLFKKLNNEE